MWCPGIGGLLTSFIFRERITIFQFQWKNTRYIVLSYFFPLIYLALSYILLWTLGLGDIDYEQITKISAKLAIPSKTISIFIYVIMITLFGMGSRFFAAIGEEIGWRGYLLSKLLTTNKPLKASIFVGIVWAIWHYPLFGFPEPGSSFTTGWLPIINFTLMVVALSVVYTKFWLVSKSIWTSFMLHTSHNLFLQSVFNPLTKWNEKTDLFADETGLLLMTIILIIAVFTARTFGDKNDKLTSGLEK
jgi:membrane protease YdiL (CAAX protease family)